MRSCSDLRSGAGGTLPCLGARPAPRVPWGLQFFGQGFKGSYASVREGQIALFHVIDDEPRGVPGFPRS